MYVLPKKNVNTSPKRARVRVEPCAVSVTVSKFSDSYYTRTPSTEKECVHSFHDDIWS